MLPASNSGVGMNMGFPDVCETPVGPVPVPIPYPNMAMHATAVPFAPDVLISFVPGLNMMAETPMTLGDQPGVESPFMGPGRFTDGNPVVMINAMPAVNLLCPTTGNDFINPVGVVAVPAITTVFFSRAGGPRPGPLDAAAMDELSRALAGPATLEPPSPDGVARLSVPVFSSGLPARVYDVLRRAVEVRALIVDLRGCPGGELIAAVELASDFLPEGAVVVTATDGDGDETVWRARGGAVHDLPVAIVVDGATASAAEVFAGALQAHGRAVVVGERTHGKGTAQALLPGPSARYETVAALALPGGEPLDGRGVRPDIEVSSSGALEAARAEIAPLLSPNEVRRCRATTSSP